MEIITNGGCKPRVSWYSPKQSTNARSAIRWKMVKPSKTFSPQRFKGRAYFSLICFLELSLSWSSHCFMDNQGDTGMSSQEVDRVTCWRSNEEPCLHTYFQQASGSEPKPAALLPTALVRKVMRSVMSICPSTVPTCKPTDLSTQFCKCTGYGQWP